MNFVHFMERFVSYFFLLKARFLFFYRKCFDGFFWFFSMKAITSLFFCCSTFILCHITINLNYLNSVFHACKTVHNNIQYYYTPNMTLNLLVLVLDKQSSHRFLSNPYPLHYQEKYTTLSPSSRL